MGCRSVGEDAEAHELPNVLFILADDMGYGDPGCYGTGSRIPTPAIDRLAREGMRFTDAHAPGSLCVPSRYGLLTGRFPFRRGALRPGREAVIEEGRTTVASLLRGRGYATAMVGKWHLGFDGGPDHDWALPLRGGPLDRGFDSWFGIPASLDIPPYYYVRDRAPVAPPSSEIGANHTEGWTPIQGAFWRAGEVAPGFAHAEVLPRLTAEAVRLLDGFASADAGPFFLYVALPAPHTPWLPLPAFEGTSGADMYGDFVAQVDHTVGTILDALDRNGQAHDTLVFFSSDNGPVWYPADVERFGHDASGGLRGMKGDAWEGGHRMPFLARWPGRVPAGAVCGRTIAFTDLLATCAELTRAATELAEGTDGESFLPTLLGRSFPRLGPLVLKADASVIRDGRWKLITHLGSGGFSKPSRKEAEAARGAAEAHAGQLYDLEADPGETHDLWSERPEIVARLQRRLADLRAP